MQIKIHFEPLRPYLYSTILQDRQTQIARDTAGNRLRIEDKGKGERKRKKGKEREWGILSRHLNLAKLSELLTICNLHI